MEEAPAEAPAVHQGPDSRGKTILAKLQEHYRSTKLQRVSEELAAQIGVSVRTAWRDLKAMAEASRQGQLLCLQDVCDYLWRRTANTQAVFYTHHQTYDETPLRCSVILDEGDSHATSQISKLFVVTTSWVIGVRPVLDSDMDAKHSILLHGHWAPAMRAATSATGKAMLAVLDTCPQPPVMIDSLCSKKFEWQRLTKMAVIFGLNVSGACLVMISGCSRKSCAYSAQNPLHS